MDEIGQVRVESIFNNLLSPEVREYFERWEMIPSMYDPSRRMDLDDVGALLEYHQHKHKLSELCGWDNPNGTEEDDWMFDVALDYLIDMLGA